MRLQSSLSSANLPHVVGCVHSYEVLEKGHAYFHHQTQTKARQLHCYLRNSSLQKCKVIAFLSHIKSLVHSLCSVGDPVSLKEHLDSILEGFPREYDNVIALIDGKIDTTTIEEVEDLSLAQELPLDQWADILTKPLSSTRFVFVRWLNYPFFLINLNLWGY